MPETNFEKESDPLEKTREKLREQIAGGDNPRLAGISFDRLKEEDILTYHRFLSKQLTLEELSAWKKRLAATESSREKSATDAPYLKDFSDRINFAAFINNEMQMRMITEYQ